MVVGGPEVVGVVDAAGALVVVGLDDELLHAVMLRAATDRTTRVRVRARVMGWFLSRDEGAGGDSSDGQSWRAALPNEEP
jgi:hypothetical protein